MDIFTILGITLLLFAGAVWWSFQSGAIFKSWDSYILSEKKALDKKNGKML